jgi:hypothetical protein
LRSVPLAVYSEHMWPTRKSEILPRPETQFVSYKAVASDCAQLMCVRSFLIYLTTLSEPDIFHIIELRGGGVDNVNIKILSSRRLLLRCYQ